jgi:hypothetical protein
VQRPQAQFVFFYRARLNAGRSVQRLHQAAVRG